MVPEIAGGGVNPDDPTGHSAAFSGEPVTNPPGVQNENMKSFFFFDTDSGEPLGKWTLTRPQSQGENCTLHNYNVVPTKHDDILVHGSYQSGIGVLDSEDGGDWSSYFYNGIIYEADITRGLFTWRLDERDTERAFKLGHLTPQTQEFTIGAKWNHDRWDESDRWEDRG